MKALDLILANLAPDGGKELAERKAQQEAAQEAEKAAQEAQEAVATTAALAAVDWERLHGDKLRKYDLALADWWQGWEVAKRKGDARNTMQPRPMRPDWYATPELKVNEHYAPLASTPKASQWQGPEEKRWTVGEGREWQNKQGGTTAAYCFVENKGARDERDAEGLGQVAYEPRSYEGAAGPHRAPSYEAQQEAQRIAWEAELARVNEGRAKA